MTFPLKTLARLLSSDATEVGSVVAIEGSAIRVATARGAVQARSVDDLDIGDRVLIRNGMATKAPVARQTYPV